MQDHRTCILVPSVAPPVGGRLNGAACFGSVNWSMFTDEGHAGDGRAQDQNKRKEKHYC